jgi:hypothetical protein
MPNGDGDDTKSVDARLGEGGSSLSCFVAPTDKVVAVVVAVVDDEVPSVVVEADFSETVERFGLDFECRMDGTRSDSRAFGSSSLVYLPMDGR